MKLLEKQIANRLLVNQRSIINALDWLLQGTGNQPIIGDLRKANYDTKDIIDRIRNDDELT